MQKFQEYELHKNKPKQKSTESIYRSNLKEKEKEILVKFLDENNEKEVEEENGDLYQLMEDAFVINKENEEEESDDFESKFVFEEIDLSEEEIEEENEEIVLDSDSDCNSKRKRKKSSKFYEWRDTVEIFAGGEKMKRKRKAYVVFFCLYYSKKIFLI
ncbi:MAG: hypothetical protein LBF97_05015 [Elusimicrobiota bacterium]|nr:hypothetical protein [Elusimicrobiota bacterium]